MYKLLLLFFVSFGSFSFAKDLGQAAGGAPRNSTNFTWKFDDEDSFHGKNLNGRLPSPPAHGISHLEQLKNSFCRAFSISHSDYRDLDAKTHPAFLYQLPCRPILNKNIGNEITWANIAQNYDGVLCTDFKTPGIKVRSIVALRDVKGTFEMKSGDSVIKFSELFQVGTISAQALEAYPNGEQNAPDIRIASSRSSYCNQFREKMMVNCNSQILCVGFAK